MALPATTEEIALETGQAGRASSEAGEDLPLRANRPFLVVLVGQGISAIGDAVSFTALPLLVLHLTGSGVAMGIVGVLQTMPDLLVGLFAGAAADRWDRRKLMLVADFGRAILIALIPASYLLGLPTMAVILVVTAPINLLRVLFLAAYTGAVPNLVGRPRIAQATSLFEAVFSLGWVLGPALAGLLAATIGPALTLAVDAGSFAVSALALAFVRRPLRAQREGPPAHILTEIRDGVAFVARHRLLRLVILFWSLVMIGEAGLIPAMTYLVTKDLGLGGEALGLVVSGFGLGSLVGSLSAGAVVRRSLALPLLGGNLVGAVAVLVLAAQATLAPLVLLSVVAGIASSFVLVAYVTVRASETPDELLGRVGSTARTLSLGLQPVGFLLTGALLDLFRGAMTLTVTALFLVVVTCAFATSRTFRSARLSASSASSTPA